MWASLSIAAGLLAMNPASDSRPLHLRCENLEDPVGIDRTQPRLTWWIESSERNSRQSAYQILVASSEAKLNAERGDLWDSGRLTSSGSTALYAGGPLTPASLIYWKVRIWDGKGRVSDWSRRASWVVGLRPDNWRGSWIGPGAKLAGHPAIMLRSRFRAKGEVARATAFLCGLGYSELFLNGEKIGNRVLDPGFTAFDRRCLYVSYDVSKQIRKGDNGVGILLGGGWFDLGTPDLFAFEKSPWTATPRAKMNLFIEYRDGKSETIVTDGKWVWLTGEITFNGVRGGETVDARRGKPAWSKASYRADDWMPVAVLEGPKGALIAQDHPPIRAHATIKPVKLTEPKPGVFVFDLGVNIAGWARLRAKGPAGSAITLKYNEKLSADGTVDMKHASSHTYGRFQTDEFILSGSGVETFEPRFTYHGFRYVQVSGLPSPPKISDIEGRWVTTNPESAGEFECSDPRINKLHQVIRRTFLNNMHGIPTDCPQREKMGWMLDGSVDMPATFLNFETPNFYRKWIGDMLDAQEPNGHVSDIIPTSGWGQSQDGKSPGEMADPWWGGAVVMAPWKHYQHYGDLRILRDSYAGMKRYVDFLTSTAKDHRIAWGLGDWLDDSAGGGGRRAPVELTSSAAYYHCADIVSRSARLLGNLEEADTYGKLASQIALSTNAKFLDPASGRYAVDSQTAHAIPLFVGMVPEDSRSIVAAQLVAAVEGRNRHISSGIVGTYYVFAVLTQIGRDDLAWKLITREDYPGWLHMLNNGATSLWEDWKGENSLNHPTLGSVGSWFYEGLAGIRTDSPGFETVLIKPAFVEGLDWVRASHTTARGVVRSAWKRAGSKIQLSVTIPANMTATVVIPTTGEVLESRKALRLVPVGGETRVSIGSGDFVFAFTCP